MDRLSQLLPSVLQKRGLLKQVRASHVVHLANEWLFERVPPLKEYARATAFQDGILIIEADHPIALQECAMCKADLCAFLTSEGYPVQGITLQRSRGNA